MFNDDSLALGELFILGIEIPERTSEKRYRLPKFGTMGQRDGYS